MKRAFLILSVIAIATVSQVVAQVSANYQYNNTPTAKNIDRNPVSNAYITNNDEIIIEVNGLSNIMADNYVAMFNLVQVGETIESVDQMMNSRIAGFKQKLKSIGIDTSEIRVDMISFVPKYDLQAENKFFSKTYNEVPSGFELQKNVTVKYKNSAKINDIVSVAAGSEIYDLVKVDYFIANIQKSVDSLRFLCLQQLKLKIKSYELVKFKLDTMRKVMAEDFVTTYPQSRYFSYQAYSRPSLNAAKKKSGSSIQNEVNKPTSIFYKQIDYDKYDIVVNPIVLEPVVQISYTITVKYFVKPDDRNNYYFVTPSGEIKQFLPK